MHTQVSELLGIKNSRIKVSAYFWNCTAQGHEAQDRRSGINLKGLLILKTLSKSEPLKYKKQLRIISLLSGDSFSFFPRLWRNFFLRYKPLINDAQGGDYEIVSLLKFYSLFGHSTVFFYPPPPPLFFFFLTVPSIPENLQVRKIADICLLKFRIVCSSWSNMSGLRYNTSNHFLLREFMSFQEQISDRLLGLVKSQSTVKESDILFSNYIE